VTPAAGELAAGLELKRVGRGWRGACPVHGGSSFTLNERDGRPVWTCWSGCDRGAILTELRARGLWPSHEETPEQREQRRRAWIEQRRRMEEAELWRRAAVAELEARQQAALEDAEQHGGPARWLKWTDCAAATYSIARLKGDELTRRLDYERQVRPRSTARLLAAGRADQREAEAIARLIVAMIAAEPNTKGRAA